MTPLEALEQASIQVFADSQRWITPRTAIDALVAAGHLPAPDVTIQVTLTPEEADEFARAWKGRFGSTEGYNSACFRVRDAILEARTQ